MMTQLLTHARQSPPASGANPTEEAAPPPADRHTHAHSHTHGHAANKQSPHSPVTALVVGTTPRIAAAALASALLWLVVAWALS